MPHESLCDLVPPVHTRSLARTHVSMRETEREGHADRLRRTDGQTDRRTESERDRAQENERERQRQRTGIIGFQCRASAGCSLKLSFDPKSKRPEF